MIVDTTVGHTGYCLKKIRKGELFDGTKARRFASLTGGTELRYRRKTNLEISKRNRLHVYAGNA